ncbi:hypothetical protein TEQG_02689 [Trichophyton equinum CBS 127.97]|uniref:Uncharacterized protein n=1 Tax=Trichophyton equinum (strain ATCC MYA-4606 / CBS 127.97) TaxID=559882 RepID=F2PP40_TRIEC|nr:hypothetical protein TEQG_02689 [Trichophyton equinum CBS 127.97]
MSNPLNLGKRLPVRHQTAQVGDGHQAGIWDCLPSHTARPTVASDPVIGCEGGRASREQAASPAEGAFNPAQMMVVVVAMVYPSITSYHVLANTLPTHNHAWVAPLLPAPQMSHVSDPCPKPCSRAAMQRARTQLLLVFAVLSCDCPVIKTLCAVEAVGRIPRESLKHWTGAWMMALAGGGKRLYAVWDVS